MTWWQPPTVQSLLQDLILDELRRLRPAQAASLQAPGQTPSPDAIELDSLERLQVASRIATFFQMREVGLEDNLLSTRTLAAWTAVVTESLARHDRTLGFSTSGSTGEPTVAIHAVERLEQESAFWAAQLRERDTPPAAILSVVPRHHIYGFLFTVLLPQALGVELIDARSWLPSRLARTLQPTSVIVGYPDFWRLFAADPTPLPPGVGGITSTAPCPGAVAQALVPARLQWLIQIYGSTETAGIGWRDTAAADYQLLPGWQRTADGQLRAQGGDGEALDTAHPDPAPPPETAPPDALEWSDARHFRILGRHDRAVAIGGLNVHPERIAAWLQQQTGVAQARVRAMRPDEGARLKAFIVPAPPDAPIAPLRAQLLAAIERELQPMERPRALTFGATLPEGTLGKAADWDCHAGA